MTDNLVINETEHPEFGKLLQTFEMKDENHMYMYLRGNQIYFVRNNKIEKTYHKDDIGELVGVFLGLAFDIDDESEEI